MFFKNEFISQVPKFQAIINHLQEYYKSTPSPNIQTIVANCETCPTNIVKCSLCKLTYLSQCVTMFDASIQDGWDIFLRPMFGLPIFMYILQKSERNDRLTIDEVITNAFAQFFYNLLTDKAHSQYVLRVPCMPLIKQCSRFTNNLNDSSLERLLCMLQDDQSRNTKLFEPFKQFIVDMMKKTRMKPQQINKVTSIVFTGFFLRMYLESAAKRQKSAAELEMRNVCRFLFKQYDDERFENFMTKMANIKSLLANEIMSTFLVSESFIRRLVLDQNLDEDLYLLLDNNNAA